MKKKFKLALILLSSLFLLQASANELQQEWGAPLVGPIGLKGIIVNVLYMKSQPDFDEQKLKLNKPMAKFLESIDVIPLLYAFDSFQSDRDITDLANLSSYYLGEAANELYECLVIRKGTRIRPVIEKLLSDKKNECIDQYPANTKMCATDQEYRERLRTFIKRITVLNKTRSVDPNCSTQGWSRM